MQKYALKRQNNSKNGQIRKNKTRKNLSFFTLAKISLAKISPLKVVKGMKDLGRGMKDGVGKPKIIELAFKKWKMENMCLLCNFFSFQIQFINHLNF